MFTKKAPKPSSTSKLLSLLTKRSSLKKIYTKNGIYDEWPTEEKPSLFNCSTNYLKYLSSCNSPVDQANSTKETRKKRSSFTKKPATFSTCTTMEFFPSTQQNIQYQNKFSSMPKSIERNQDFQGQKKQLKFTPYVTPLQDTSEILDESDSHLKNVNDQEYEGKMNSKYKMIPKTFNLQKKSTNQERRFIKTAKINRQELHTEESNEQQSHRRKLSTGRLTPSTNARSISIKNSAFAKMGMAHGNLNGMKSPSLRSNNSKENLEINYEYPMRLKDYETNFQAYKVISELIDQQMKWEPKRVRPKSSVLFRKYNVGVKA